MLGLEAVRMALVALWAHKLRSAMTILGVVIGVGSVLTVTSLSAAFEDSITGQFDAIDDRSIFIAVGQTGVQNGPPDAGQYGLIFTEHDRLAVAALPGVDRVSATGDVPVTGISYGDQDRPFALLTATTADADEVRDPGDYLVGGPFVDGTEQVVLGYAVAATLSDAPDGADPAIAAGDTLTLHQIDGSERNVTVAGVLAKQESLFGTNNGQIFAPVDPFYTTQRTSPATGQSGPVYGGFTAIAGPGADIGEVRDAIDAYMTGPSDAATLIEGLDGLEILVATASDISAQISSAFDQITLFIAGIAGISLLVGGIMIGTIMLVSVTERTKEIGMMKAIGALDREILFTFLLEASMVGLLGSVLGIGLGLGGGAALVAALLGNSDPPVSFVVPWDWVGWSVLVGVGTGIVAGFLPARRATKIEPVQALSYE